MNGYGYGGGGYRRGYGWGRPAVYPGGGDGKRTWAQQNRVINLNPNPGTTQASQTLFTQSVGSGTTTIKNIRIVANAGSATTQAVFWAIVYVPAGTTAGTLTPAATGNNPLYQAQQFIMAIGSFIADTDAVPINIFTPLARKCNPNDSIQFISVGTNAAAYQMVGSITFASGT